MPNTKESGITRSVGEWISYAKQLEAERDALREAGLKALDHAEKHGLTDATYWVRDLRAALGRPE